MTEQHNVESTWRRLFSFKNKTSQKSSTKYVLIVDDEKPFLLSLTDGLSMYKKDFTVLTALNGREAVKILNAYRIDLVVTDLRMPKMDGFELLAYMTQNYADIPVIVMTAFGTPEIESHIHSIGRFQYLEKPMDITVLANSIFNGLSATPSKDSKQSINLSTFLHLIEMENTTCTLRVNSDDKNGYLYFDKGRLLSATTERLEGREAALDMLSWSNAELDIKFKCEMTDGNIEGTLSQILTDASTKIEDKVEDDHQMINEEARRRAEDETRKQAEEEARLKAEEEEEKRRADDEARKAAEEKARKQAEEEARLKAEEEEEKRRADDEARKAAEEKARKQAEEEARLKAEEEEEKQKSDEVTRQKLMAWKKATKI